MTEKTIRGYSLSPQQRRLWLLQRAGDEHHYLAQCAVLLDGIINKPIFIAALKQVVEAHSILRTTFKRLPGLAVPLQVVNESGELPVDGYDLSEWDSDEGNTNRDASRRSQANIAGF